MKKLLVEELERLQETELDEMDFGYTPGGPGPWSLDWNRGMHGDKFNPRAWRTTQGTSRDGGGPANARNLGQGQAGLRGGSTGEIQRDGPNDSSSTYDETWKNESVWEEMSEAMNRGAIGNALRALALISTMAVNPANAQAESKEVEMAKSLNFTQEQIDRIRKTDKKDVREMLLVMFARQNGIIKPDPTANDPYLDQQKKDLKERDGPTDFKQAKRHGGDKRPTWDQPLGRYLRDKIKDDEEQDVPLEEIMGVPFSNDRPKGSNGDISARDSKPVQDKNGHPVSPEQMETPINTQGGPGTMWGAHTVPISDPTKKDEDPLTPGTEEEEENMKLRHFFGGQMNEEFDPTPIVAEPLTNPMQDYMHDTTDEEIETDIDQIWGREDNDNFKDGGELPGVDGDDDPESFIGRYGGETIFVMPKASSFSMSTDRAGNARGLYGMHMKEGNKGELLDKRSAWDILQWVVYAMANKQAAQEDNQQNVENTDQPG